MFIEATQKRLQPSLRDTFLFVGLHYITEIFQIGDRKNRDNEIYHDIP